jgi:hypothetical protein
MNAKIVEGINIPKTCPAKKLANIIKPADKAKDILT